MSITRYLACLLACACAAPVWAIDAAGIARPAGYVWTKPGDVHNGTPEEVRVSKAEAQERARMQGAKTAPLPTKPQRMANGKVFVPVAKNSQCTLKAGGSLSLEEQLRACTGLPADNAR